MKTVVSRRPRPLRIAILCAFAAPFAAFLALPVACGGGERAVTTSSIALRSGETIAFLGDSITSEGVASPSGYVSLVMRGLEANGVRATMIPAGVRADTSRDMRARLEKDVLAAHPDWMTLSCGVNDVGHSPGVALDEYKANITDMVDRAQAAGIKVLVLTSTLIYEDAENDVNQNAIPYNDFLRELARQRNLPLADLNADERAVLAAIPEALRKSGNQLTTDGVHMNPQGNQMIATGVLRAMGLRQAQMKNAHNSWRDI